MLFVSSIDLQDGTTLQLPVVDIDIANATKTQVGNVMFYENLLNCIIYHCYIIKLMIFDLQFLQCANCAFK